MGQISVGLASHSTPSIVMVSPLSGSYVLQNEKGDTVYVFRKDDAISFTQQKDGIVVKSVYGNTDTLKAVYLIGNGVNPAFKMRFGTEKKEHTYFQSLEIAATDKGLKLVNQVDIERYVSRVVQAEVGYGAEQEYYKIQSIICRTYAIRNLERHVLDGYDLCDNEHCQVYSGLKAPTNEVIKATASTSGLVMVDDNENLILSAFHANCGGQTANSEDVWKESRTYLSSVNDTFCLRSRSAIWDKTIPLSEFISQIGFGEKSLANGQTIFRQPNRKKYFKLGADSVPTAKMRRYLGLRSAFFDLEIKDNQVNISGKGYGHGVGLCQQGAMQMAATGYTFSQILGYYYKGVSLVPITSLQPEK